MQPRRGEIIVAVLATLLQSSVRSGIRGDVAPPEQMFIVDELQRCRADGAVVSVVWGATFKSLQGARTSVAEEFVRAFQVFHRGWPRLAVVVDTG